MKYFIHPFPYIIVSVTFLCLALAGRFLGVYPQLGLLLSPVTQTIIFYAAALVATLCGVFFNEWAKRHRAITEQKAAVNSLILGAILITMLFTLPSSVLRAIYVYEGGWW
ncbi:MAG: hypothetical protein COU08_00250 [Candidatus Harrisonbacteria bacterium CG10_big_fil_rev_8_21_14_0_10_42_17]|uniref:Uncharacterized protein n=1 Tax=Candidatus Harrisonbacteria bacterium CG10_big_fil_rev_8_21_14_0_10_42_17 TaxID=1974584 RepID=A0A2M6WJA6_9BACT|nr:MAG: hypothetical protein COU08_00250 [Candidatus Harrisonbacteria bacterium CG10_big_fil_rev_8_21_14_0_10_42_17]